VQHFSFWSAQPFHFWHTVNGCKNSLLATPNLSLFHLSSRNKSRTADVCETWYWEVLLKSAITFQLRLKSDNRKGHIIWTAARVYGCAPGDIRWIFIGMKNVPNKYCIERRNVLVYTIYLDETECCTLISLTGYPLNLFWPNLSNGLKLLKDRRKESTALYYNCGKS
jgi:hypothetical protein